MTTTSLLCIDDPAPSATCREYTYDECVTNMTHEDTRAKLLSKHMGGNEADLRGVSISDRFRRKLLRETEQYLSSPDNRSWARALMEWYGPQ